MNTRGFTLLEVVVALALAATLMVMLLQVTVSVRRGHTALEADNAPRDNATVALVELLQQDLAHAREVATGENVLRITGHFIVDTETLQPDHRPTQITYALVPGPDDQGQWLVREQVRFAATGDHVGSIEIVGWDMNHLSVVPSKPTEPDSRGWEHWPSPLPEWSTLTLVWWDGDEHEAMVTLK